jgi:hypothetical protein
MNFRLKYRLRRARVRFRRIWAVITLDKKISNPSDVELAIKIVKRMLAKDEVDIRHSPIASIFHVSHGHLYAKISENSITIINGRYAYELLLPAPAGYDLIMKMRMVAERRLMKAEAAHRERIDRSLLNIYNSLDENEN